MEFLNTGTKRVVWGFVTKLLFIGLVTLSILGVREMGVPVVTGKVPASDLVAAVSESSTGTCYLELEISERLTSEGAITPSLLTVRPIIGDYSLMVYPFYPEDGDADYVIETFGLNKKTISSFAVYSGLFPIIEGPDFIVLDEGSTSAVVPIHPGISGLRIISQGVVSTLSIPTSIMSCAGAKERLPDLINKVRQTIPIVRSKIPPPTDVSHLAVPGADQARDNTPAVGKTASEPYADLRAKLESLEARFRALEAQLGI